MYGKRKHNDNTIYLYMQLTDGVPMEVPYANRQSALQCMTSQTVTGSRLTGHIVNVMRSPVIERLMV